MSITVGKNNSTNPRPKCETTGGPGQRAAFRVTFFSASCHPLPVNLSFFVPVIFLGILASWHSSRRFTTLKSMTFWSNPCDGTSCGLLKNLARGSSRGAAEGLAQDAAWRAGSVLHFFAHQTQLDMEVNKSNKYQRVVKKIPTCSWI